MSALTQTSLQAQPITRTCQQQRCSRPAPLAQPVEAPAPWPRSGIACLATQCSTHCLWQELTVAAGSSREQAVAPLSTQCQDTSVPVHTANQWSSYSLDWHSRSISLSLIWTFLKIDCTLLSKSSWSYIMCKKLTLNRYFDSAGASINSNSEMINWRLSGYSIFCLVAGQIENVVFNKRLILGLKPSYQISNLLLNKLFVWHLIWKLQSNCKQTNKICRGALTKE